MNGQEPLEGNSPPTSNSIWSCSAKLSSGLKKKKINKTKVYQHNLARFLPSEKEGQAVGGGVAVGWNHQCPFLPRYTYTS